MSTAEKPIDKWADWLLNKRFGGNRESYEQTMKFMGEIRDRVLKMVDIKTGETVLDVGCGDGLLAAQSLEFVGEEGKVIFSDISQSCIDHCQTIFGSDPRASFILLDAADLSRLEDSSIDVIVMRSVLIYVNDKTKAFSEFHRVLKPNGRLAFFEPINRFSDIMASGTQVSISGLDFTPLNDLVKKIGQGSFETESQRSAMMDFDERDLLTFGIEAGFVKQKLEYEAAIDYTQKWPNSETLLDAVPNPNAKSLRTRLKEALTIEEQMEFISYLEEQLVTQSVKLNRAAAYYCAVKEG